VNALPQAFAVIPAAGVGRRMGSQIPKQYLPLAGSTVMEHTLRRFLMYPRIQAIVVAISATDSWWPQCTFANHPQMLIADGGSERCHSVLNALHKLREFAADDAWVLVHDAVRPCLRSEDLDQLFEKLATSSIGGLLGVPVRDTMKRIDANNAVQATVSRTNLWHAYTPQMFRFNLLYQALNQAMQQNLVVTDEAEAIELAGYQPVMVAGHADNLKITRQEDLALAEFFIGLHNANS